MGHSVLASYIGGIQEPYTATTTLLSHHVLCPGLCNGLLTHPPSSFLAHFRFILHKAARVIFLEWMGLYYSLTWSFQRPPTALAFNPLTQSPEPPLQLRLCHSPVPLHTTLLPATPHPMLFASSGPLYVLFPLLGELIPLVCKWLIPSHPSGLSWNITSLERPSKQVQVE